MPNPYRGKPAHQFWRSGVAAPAPTDVDPVTGVTFRIAPTDKIATAGSCFAQHIARKLAASGYNYMVTEQSPSTAGAENQNYGTFSARFGNIYSVRQLLQLFRRAYSTFEPAERPWRRSDGRLLDPFRPQIQAGGWLDEAELLADRAAHLAAVRTMFEQCDVFVFTLGLTEAWLSTVDGAVFPVAPGVVAPEHDSATSKFHNFTVAEMEEDLARFVDYLRGVDPAVRIILTVSPVPLIATYEPRHVLASTVYSKSALRVVADQVERRYDGVDYFPSYEMITGPHTRGAFFADDLREVRAEGVAYVMRHFGKHYLAADVAPRARRAPAVDRSAARRPAPGHERIMAQAEQVICDGEAIERALDGDARGAA